MANSSDDLSFSDLLADAKAKLASKPPEVKLTGGANKAYQEVISQWAAKRRWIATLWLLGASTRMLAQATSVSSSSVNQSLNKELPPYERIKLRLQTALTHTGFSWYTQLYFENIKTTQSLTPQAAAKWLLDNHPYAGD